jgi:prolycopene isomerase
MSRVAIIGAGLAGLSAGAHLATSGHEVTVLEHHTVPGGYAHEFTRRGYRFEVALHALDGAGPGGWLYGILSDLGVLDSLELRRLDPLYTVRIGGQQVTAHADVNEYRAGLVELFPEDAEGIDELIEAIKRIGRDIGRYTADRSTGARPGPAEMLSRYPDMSAAFMQPWGPFIEQHLSDLELRAFFSTLWGYFGLPPSRLSAGLFAAGWASYHLNGGYYPVGGSQALSRALESVILDHGGTVHYRNTVTGIDIEDGLAARVRTHRDLAVDSDLVISTAGPLDTIGFAGAEHFGSEYISTWDAEIPALSNLVVYLGLDRDIAADGWDHHEFFLEDQPDVEASYEAAAAGRFGETGMVITNYTHSDPGCAPEGGSVLVLMTLAPWDHRGVWGTGGDLADYSKNPDYVTVKEEAGAVLVERAASLIPGLTDSIVIKEIATPLTNVRYGRQPFGSIYGREQTVENMFTNRRSPKTPIPNLLLAGAWVAGGGMSTTIGSGRTAAAIARKVLST